MRKTEMVAMVIIALLIWVSGIYLGWGLGLAHSNDDLEKEKLRLEIQLLKRQTGANL